MTAQATLTKQDLYELVKSQPEETYIHQWIATKGDKTCYCSCGHAALMTGLSPGRFGPEPDREGIVQHLMNIFGLTKDEVFFIAYSMTQTDKVVAAKLLAEGYELPEGPSWSRPRVEYGVLVEAD